MNPAYVTRVLRKLREEIKFSARWKIHIGSPAGKTNAVAAGRGRADAPNQEKPMPTTHRTRPFVSISIFGDGGGGGGGVSIFSAATQRLPIGRPTKQCDFCMNAPYLSCFPFASTTITFLTQLIYNVIN